MNDLHGLLAGYAAAGWHPLPLPARAKKPVPAGYTGGNGSDAGAAELASWAVQYPPDANVALRMPAGVVGIDVDSYGDKPGAATFGALVAAHGSLPPTWVSTSRGTGEGPGASGIAFYRVPVGRAFPGQLGAGIEAIQRHHRYAVVWPSLHPEGRQYRWYAPDGRPSPMPPNVADLPELPAGWLDGLPSANSGPRAQVSARTGSAWLDGLLSSGSASEGACPEVTGTVLSTPERLHTGASRHDTMTSLVYQLVAQAADGHRGLDRALSLLRQQWERLGLDAEDTERGSAAEFDRMLAGAARKIAAEHPDGPAPRDPCRSLPDLKAKLAAERGASPGSDAAREPSGRADRLDALEAAVFGTTPRLDQIRQGARSRLMSPWSVLGCVLARVVAETPVPVVLPPTIGGDASLNLAVALVGPSGVGKSSSDKVARDLLAGGARASGDVTDALALNSRIRPAVLGAGSGEGIVQSFLEYVEVPLPAGAPNPGAAKPKEWRLRDHPHSLLVVDEIERLEAVKSRNGSTLGPILRSAITGDNLSTSNATRDRDRRVPELSYRFAVVAGVQPELAGILLDDASAGTPQRWAWLPVTDTHPADDDHLPDWPGPLDWLPVQRTMPGPDGRVRVSLPDEARRTIRDAHRARLRNLDRAHSLDGHALLTRTKVAAALAFLHGEPAVTPAWWELAGLVMEVSDLTRGGCVQVLARAAHERTVAAGQRLGVQDQVREATRAAMIAPQLAELVWQQVHRHNGGSDRPADAKHDPGAGCTGRCLSRALRHRGGAEHRDAAIADAEARGWIIATDDNPTRWLPGNSQPAATAGGEVRP